MKMHKVVTGMLVAGVLTGACSGGDSGNDQSAAPIATTPIETVVPTATPVRPTAVVETTPTAAPTPTPDAQAAQDAAVIEAWQRYLELSFAARGKDPSAEALDFDSYVTGGAKDGLIGAIEHDADTDQYVSGGVVSMRPTFFYFETGDARLSDCVDVNLALLPLSDGSPRTDQSGLFVVEARLEPLGDQWIVAAYEAGELCDA